MVAVIEGVVAPVFHVPPLVFPLKSTEPPTQNVTAPLALTIEFNGCGFTVIVILLEVAVGEVAQAILLVRMHLKISLFAAVLVL